MLYFRNTVPKLSEPLLKIQLGNYNKRQSNYFSWISPFHSAFIFSALTCHSKLASSFFFAQFSPCLNTHLQAIIKWLKSRGACVHGLEVRGLPWRPDHLEISIIPRSVLLKRSALGGRHAHSFHTRTAVSCLVLPSRGAEKFRPVGSISGRALLDFSDVFQRS